MFDLYIPLTVINGEPQIHSAHIDRKLAYSKIIDLLKKVVTEDLLNIQKSIIEKMEAVENLGKMQSDERFHKIFLEKRDKPSEDDLVLWFGKKIFSGHDFKSSQIIFETETPNGDKYQIFKISIRF